MFHFPERGRGRALVSASVASASGRAFQTVWRVGHAQVIQREGVVGTKIGGLGRRRQVGRDDGAGVMAVTMRASAVHRLLALIAIVIDVTRQDLVCGRQFDAALGGLDDRRQSEHGDDQREERRHPPGSRHHGRHRRRLADFTVYRHQAVKLTDPWGRSQRQILKGCRSTRGLSDQDSCSEGWGAQTPIGCASVTATVSQVGRHSFLQRSEIKSLIIKEFSSDYESGGRAFESLRVRHFLINNRNLLVLLGQLTRGRSVTTRTLLA